MIKLTATLEFNGGFQQDNKSQQKILQAVQGNPPNNATGREGAVGQIHLICIKRQWILLNIVYSLKFKIKCAGIIHVHDGKL